MDMESVRFVEEALELQRSPPENTPQDTQTPADTKTQVVSSMAFAPFSEPKASPSEITNQPDTDRASYPGPETNPAQHQPELQEHDQPSDDNPSKPDSAPKSDLDPDPDPESSHPEPCLQRESAKAVSTMSSCCTAQFSSATTRRSVNLASLTSPEIDSAPKRDTAASPKESIQDVHCVSWREGSAETAVAPGPSCPSSAPGPPTIVDPVALTLVETDTVERQDNTSNKKESILDSSHDAVGPEPPRTAPRLAAPSARRSRAARSFTVSAGRRGLHTSKAPTRGAGRELQNLLAQAQPDPLPLRAQRPDVRRGQTLPRTPNPSRAAHRVRGGRHGPQNLRALPMLQAYTPANGPVNAAAVPGRIPVVDMDGVPHVIGGLVEASMGRKDLLFAKEVLNDPWDCYNNLKVIRHQFFTFPAPDLSESNREFDRELEECRPTFWGFHPDEVDKQIDDYAEGTKHFAKLMEEHQAEFDPVYKTFSSIKADLTHLNYERQRAITSEYASKPVMTAQTRRKRIAEVAEAELPFMRDMEIVRPQLNELVLRARVKIAHALKQDLRAPNAIDEKRTRAYERKFVEEKETELGVAGAMMGLRGTPKEQNLENSTAIMRYTRRIVDERMREFDEPDELHQVDKPARPEEPPPPNLAANLAAVVTTIPAWFTILDAKGTVELYGATPLDRFRELTQTLGNSYSAARDEKWTDESRPHRYSWPKQYHEPHAAWPNPKQRTRGGWWTCRSGPDASPAERSCRLCHTPDPAPSERRSSADVHQHILDEIEKAMAEANKRDRLVLKCQLQQEREDIDQYWQHREWMRSGGCADLKEMLNGRGVNELNYRPSAGRSQSWHPQDAMVHSQNLSDMPVEVTMMERSQSWSHQSSRGVSREDLAGKETTDQNGVSNDLPEAPSHQGGAPQRPKLVRGQRFRPQQVLPSQPSQRPEGSAHQAEFSIPSQRPAGLHPCDTISPHIGPSQQRLAGSRVHPLLSGRQLGGNTPSPVTSSPRPSQGLGRSPCVHPLLSGLRINENTSPQAPGPSQPTQRPGTSRVHPLLSGMVVSDTTSLAAGGPCLASQHGNISPAARPLLYERAANNQDAPTQVLHRHNSSQVHDVLHGRQANNGTPGPSQLRSALVRPGHKATKDKRVSWQY